MSDVVVTVPKRLWAEWLTEGDAAGEPETRQEYWFSVSTTPRIMPGDRVYVVAHGRLRGYAPLVRIQNGGPGRVLLIRGAGAVAVTIDEPVRGFQGWRYRWWDRQDERPFPEWRTL